MRIIRPYGTSATEWDAAEHGELRRVLRREAEPVQAEERQDIETFAANHDALVIGQWISTIDKIAAKPGPNKKPSASQRKLRQRLGEAAWRYMVADECLPGLERDPTLETLWWMKVHPYPNGDGEKGQRVRGRWYRRFAGETSPREIDADQVVRRIAEHLYEHELPIHPELQERKKGRIAHRAASIARSAPRLDDRGTIARSTPQGRPDAAWEAAWTDYAAKGDVAGRIHEAAEAIESTESEKSSDGKLQRRWVGLDVAAKELYEHWRQVFFCPEKQRPLSATEVKELVKKQEATGAELNETETRIVLHFDIHEEVRGVYRRLLKRHRKEVNLPDGRPPRPSKSDVARLLPASMDQLRRMLLAQRANRDVNALIRLGKVIHYEASEQAAAPAAPAYDAPVHVLTSSWPNDVSVKASRFWTSDGQAEIKANEAFVRIWRRLLALMHRTASDWAALPGSDVTSEITLKRAVDEAFDGARHRSKIELLFGARADLFTDGTDAAALDRAVLCFALERLRDLRNASFHFVGLGRFRDALIASLAESEGQAALTQARMLWEQDLHERVKRLGRVLHGAHVSNFLDADQTRRLFASLVGAKPSDLPLPRFQRVLLRTGHIRDKASDVPQLPEPGNLLDLKDPALLCRYTALKLVYDRPFRQWLADEANTGCVAVHIQTATRRDRAEAQRLHPEEDAARRELIRAKAERVGYLAPQETIRDFVARLTRETAGEMRVQSGYESNKENARKQAEYIEDLLRDVMARAFLDYLHQADLAFLLEIDSDQTVDPAIGIDPRSLPAPAPDVQAQPWQIALYFMVHLAPVDDVAMLLHQLRKFSVLTRKRAQVTGSAETAETLQRDVGNIIAVLELYLDMHDDKFKGGRGMTGLDAFAALFETRGLFEQVVARPVRDGDPARVPTRGLREIARYGHLDPLRRFFEQAKVTREHVAARDHFEHVVDDESAIAKRQRARRDLHAQWQKAPKSFPGESLREYIEVLRDVAEHRRLNNHVTLVTHVRLHRLTMMVIGRLLDFSGLFERDLYFTSLALLHRLGLEPKSAFKRKKLVEQGRIVAAVRGLEGSVRLEIESLFDLGDSTIQVRNRLAHFDMLQPAETDAKPVDLTREVNGCRRLMRYDRKLQNAVSQSVIDLLEREGIRLRSKFEAARGLCDATIETEYASHLRKIKIYERAEPAPSDGKQSKPKSHEILEALHGDEFVRMVAALFGGRGKANDRDVCHIPLERIDWARGPAKRQQRPLAQKESDPPATAARWPEAEEARSRKARRGWPPQVG